MKHPALIATLLVLATALFASPATAADSARILRLATTTSTYETGLLDHILPPFKKQHGLEVHVISVGTGKAMALARAGDVDAILVHARAAEDRFVREGYGVHRRDVMANDFVIAGPEDDPAGVRGQSSAEKALQRIAREQSAFVSRGDDSGTHKKEMQLWAAAGITPNGDWYIEAGQGMGSTLTMADEKNAYILVDRASFLAGRDRLRLHVLVEGEPALLNPYGVIAVNPARHPHARIESADALIEWLVSPRCRKMIAGYKTHGVQLFEPAADDAAGTGDVDNDAE